MLQHYLHMSYAYYKFDNQMYCIQHTLLNIFSYCLLNFTNPILHTMAIRPLIHMRLSDNPTQKNYKFCFLFLSKTIYMYNANITLLYLMCAVEMLPKCRQISISMLSCMKCFSFINETTLS